MDQILNLFKGSKNQGIILMHHYQKIAWMMTLCKVYLQIDYKANVEFIRDQLQEQQVRDDYKELLTLSLVFIGAPEANNVHINSPRAYHRARWIAIYCLKMYLFRQQFNFL